MIVLAVMVSRRFGDSPSEPLPRRLARRTARKVKASPST
jgi:hypothetical protein